MNTADRTSTSPRLLLGAAAFVLALFAALVGGCGGGVGTGGTGTYSEGTIGGFGSVIVNDVRYDDSSAAVLDASGNRKSSSDLRLGMTVAVDAGAVVDSGNGPAATASRIQYASEIVGPLAAVDRGTGVLVVLGQTVVVDATTVFDERLAGGVAALAAGQFVEIYAQIDAASGRYRATRIEPHAAGSYTLRGIAAHVSNGGRSFDIGNASFASETTPSSSVSEGGFVRITLQAAPAGSLQWAVQGFGGGFAPPEDGRHAQLKGLISRFESAASFAVNGHPVDASGAQAPSGLALGIRVEVEGTLAGGVLHATKVEIKTDADEKGHGFELHGQIASMDAAARTFQLRGVTVSYASPGVEFDHGGAADLAGGVAVEVRGVLSSDGTRLNAQRITFDH